MADDQQRSPTFESELGQRIDRLSPDRRAIFERRLTHARTEQLVIPAILRVSGENPPLSFAQQRMWFLHQLHPDLPLYNNTRALRLSGPLDVAVLERVLNEIVRRHESLRTTFLMGDHGAVQVIAPHLAIPLAVVDLTGAADAEEEARRVAADDASLPFELSRGPLLRTTLLRLDGTTHLLLLTIHHIVSDRWSMTVFFKEVSQLYGAFRKGEASPLRELACQYADFAVWQRERMNGPAFEPHLAYWRGQLAPPHPVLELAPNRSRPMDAQKFAGGRHQFVVGKELAATLRAFSRRQRTTLFMTLLAAFQTLLSRYTGERDIIVGSPIAGRPRVETEALIGFFVNTLALRTSLADDPTVGELLNRVRQTALDAYDHQEVPFERLVELLQPERSVDHTPFFQVMFALQNVPRYELSLPELTLTSENVFTNTAKFDLLVVFVDGPDGLAGRIEYRTDILSIDTVRQIERHLVRLLEVFPDSADRRISTLPLLDTAERRRMLEEWNDTRSDYPRDHTVHGIFQERVAQRPDAIAVIDRGRAISYSDLNRRANRLAHRLQSAGVRPDELVGIFLDRSLELIVGLLAILKSGAGYLPLDSRSPRERLNWMLDDARVRIVLTDRLHAAELPASDRRLTLLLDRDEEHGGESVDNPVAEAAAEHTAYAMYTSGSTGQPKGVLVPHRAISRLLINTNYISLQPSDVVAQASICSFDAATFEIWGALLHGARLAVIPEHTILSPSDFAAELERLGVTTLFVTTALFNLMAAQRPNAFNSLTQVLFGGEAADPRAVAAVLKAGGPRRLLHVYGPTESTTFASWYQVTDVADDQRAIPIGRPLSNTQLYLLDRNLEPVPAGALGEIYIGGDGVARGYLNDETLTAQRFVPDPFNNRRDARLYKTGDLGQLRPDGNFEFVGRYDHQIKIRGFRVEPGEIEAVLQVHPAVRRALIVAREDVPGEKRLVAYIVAKESSASLIPDLQQIARARLPDYLVPTFWVLLEAMPLTPAGKLDRQALPPPDTNALQAVGGYQAPRDDLEVRLTKVWEELLRRSRIGVTDNFFDLGGHSLLAAQLCATIEKTFGARLPVASFLEGATVERQAEILRGRDMTPLWSPLVAIRAGGTKPPFFCIHGVGGNVLGFKDLARRLPLDQPVYGLQSRGLDGKGDLDFRVEDMAAHYITHVRRVQPTGPYALGGLSFGGLVAFEMARQLQQQGHEVALLALFDASAGRRRALGLKPWLRNKASDYKARAALHARHLIYGPARATYILKRSRTIRRRIKNRLWHLTYNIYRWFDYSLPQPLLIVTHANFHARREYTPQFYAGRVTLFRALERESNADPRLGWGPLAGLGVEIHHVPGNHVTMLAEPHVQTLGEKLARCLEDARNSPKRR
jgi:amino acid adenylation domain-containing protein